MDVADDASGKGAADVARGHPVGARLEEGDLLEAEITPDGILLRPQKLIDATQAWFWNPSWQAGEREADADRAAGRVENFDSGEALIAGLRSAAKPVRPRRKR